MTPRAELLRIYHAQNLPVHTGHTIAHRDRLIREMSAILVKGYALDNEEFTPGIRSLGCALLNPKGRAMCAIAIEGPRLKFSSTEKRTCFEFYLPPGTRSWSSVK